MDDYLDRFDQDRDRVEDLLRPLAHSFGAGLPTDALGRPGHPTGRTHPHLHVQDIGWLLNTAADYLLETTADTRAGRGTAYRLYHRALIDDLRDQNLGHGGVVESDTYQWLLTPFPAAHREMRTGNEPIPTS